MIEYEKNTVEYEKSYVFTHEKAKTFIESHNLQIKSEEQIEDYYLDDQTRIRKISNGKDLHITKKIGNKKDGHRIEKASFIPVAAFESLVHLVKTVIKKTRQTLICPNNYLNQYLVTMDFVHEPMRLAILEAESGEYFPGYPSISLFGENLKECPLSACSLFNRKITLCGTSSSGKTETAKKLSHVLNTQFSANSYHVPEFATTFIQKYKINPSFWNEFLIYSGQLEREQNANHLANIIVSDCPTFLTYIYLSHLPKDKFSKQTALVFAKMYKRVLFDISRYTDIVLLNLIDYKENNVRYQKGKEEALEIENRIISFLNDHNIVYTLYDYTQFDEIVNDLFYLN